MSTAAAPPPVALPRITVQPDYPAVLRDIHQGLHAVEDFWVSCYAEASVHGRVRITEEDNRAVSLLARDGVSVTQISDSELSISCDNLAIPSTPVHFPVSTPFTLKGGIDALAISSNGASFLVGGKDSKVRVGSVSGEKIVELRGHVGDLTSVAWFPSNEVVLTGSSDFSIRIFSAIDGTNPRTLTGHTKSITGLAILGVGKNVLSSSLDGTIRLWSVGSATETSLIRLDHPIASMVVSSASSNSMETDSTDEDDLRGKVAIVGFSNGNLAMIDLSVGVKEGAKSLSTGAGSSITCVDFDQETRLVVCGTRSGAVHVFDTSAIVEEEGPLLPICSFTRSGASILSVGFSRSTTSAALSPAASTPSILVGTADGLPYRAGLNLTILDEPTGKGSVRVLEEFAGIDCDSSIVTEVKETGQVWVGGGDGVLRRYRKSL